MADKDLSFLDADLRAVLEATVRNLPMAVALVEAPSGRPVLVNAALENLLGFCPTSAVSLEEIAASIRVSGGEHLYAPEDWPLARSITIGEVVTGEDVEVVRADGSRSDIRISTVPVRDGNGALVGGFFTCYDVTQPRRAQRMQKFLSEATTLLSRSLDSATITTTLVKLAVPTIADLCLVYVRREDGSLRLEALEHVDPEHKAVSLDLGMRYAIDPAGGTSIARVLRGEPSQLLTDFTEEELSIASGSEEHLRYLLAAGYHSGMVVPLPGRDAVFGALVFVSRDPVRRYTPLELEVAGDLARRAALAIENARLFEAERRSREAAERLQQLTEALSTARTPVDAAEAFVHPGRAALGASVGAVWLLADDGETLDLVACDGWTESIRETYRKSHLGCDLPICDAIRRGEMISLGSIEERMRRYPGLGDGAMIGNTAWIIIPLLVHGRAVGAAVLSFVEPPQLTGEARALMMAMAGQVGQAVERTRLLDAERRAREALVESEERLRIALSAARVGTWRRDLRTGLDECDANHNHILGLESNGESMQPIADFFGYVHPADRAVTEEVFEHAIRERVEYQADFRILRTDGSMRWVHDRGKVVFDAAGKPSFMTGALVDMTEQKRAEARLRFLAEATTALASSLDYEETLATAVRLAALPDDSALAEQARNTSTSAGDELGPRAPAFADWCSIDILNEEGKIRRTAASYSDPTRAFLAPDRMRRYAPRPEASIGAANVIRTGRSELVSTITDAMLQAVAHDAEHLALLREARLTSYMTVPLAVRGRVFGAMTFIQAELSQRYQAEDVVFAEQIAARVATALENARLYGALVESEEKATAAYAIAKEAERRKDEFLAMLGHELRNPLAPIITALELMKRKRTSGSEREREVIERQVTHLSRLVDDLMDISRITRGKVELKKGPVEIGEVIGAALEMASPLLERQRHKLVLSVPHKGMQVEGDRTRLAQVIGNLLTNAAKYTELGGLIEVRAHREGGEVWVVVKDNGIGIPRELLQQVFELFVQGSRTLERAEGGLGIGLTLVRILVDLHGGSVTAHSEGPGQGSEFTVRLPELRSAAPADEDGGEALDSASQAPEVVELRRRVLVVDDNIDAADTLAEMVSFWGYEVATAHDGLRALAAAAELKPDVVLLDIGLPVMDGYEVARALRADGRYNGMKLFAITGYGQEEDRTRVREAGFDEHFVKPVSLEALEEAMR